MKGFAGRQQMRDKIARFEREYPKRIGAALFFEGQVEMTESKLRCPVDTTPNAPHPGALRRSGQVHPPEYREKTISVTLSYGDAEGGLVDYAIYVHENPDAFHPVGQWKFLESVLSESAPHMLARVAQHIHLDKVVV